MAVSFGSLGAEWLAYGAPALPGQTQATGHIHLVTLRTSHRAKRAYSHSIVAGGLELMS